MISIGMMRINPWDSSSLVPRYIARGEGERGSFLIMTMRPILAMKRVKNLDYNIFR
jgi:hypothetical protein